MLKAGQGDKMLKGIQTGGGNFQKIQQYPGQCREGHQKPKSQGPVEKGVQRSLTEFDQGENRCHHPGLCPSLMMGRCLWAPAAFYCNAITAEYITGIDKMSVSTFASLCTQATIETFLWGMWKTVNLPDFGAITNGLAVWLGLSRNLGWHIKQASSRKWGMWRKISSAPTKFLWSMWMLSREDPTLGQGNNQWADPHCQLNVETTPEQTGMWPISSWIQVRMAFENLDTILGQAYTDCPVRRRCCKSIKSLSHPTSQTSCRHQCPSTDSPSHGVEYILGRWNILPHIKPLVPSEDLIRSCLQLILSLHVS